MPIRGGRTASWLGRNAKRAGSSVRHGDVLMPMAVAGIGVAAVGGATSGVLDREGPWADVQEFAFGDPEALRASMKAGLSEMVSGSDNVYGRNDSYYGRPISTDRDHGPAPVSGDMVFGMYNLRR